jgi:hypothetical protein
MSLQSRDTDNKTKPETLTTTHRTKTNKITETLTTRHRTKTNKITDKQCKKKQIQKAKAKIQKKHTTQKAKQGNNTPTKKSRMKPRTRERQKVRPVIEEKIWV